jgi:uncharacterized protein YegP (UPF0339 family)
MSGIRITYYTDVGGQERVRISGANGEPMFTSEGYTRTQGAANAIQVLADAFRNGDVKVVETGETETVEVSEDEETGDEQHVEAE